MDKTTVPVTAMDRDKVPFTEKDIKDYLDGAIRNWRKIRDESVVDSHIAPYYVDAFQSVRVSLFGEMLPKE